MMTVVTHVILAEDQLVLGYGQLAVRGNMLEMQYKLKAALDTVQVVEVVVVLERLIGQQCAVAGVHVSAINQVIMELVADPVCVMPTVCPAWVAAAALNGCAVFTAIVKDGKALADKGAIVMVQEAGVDVVTTKVEACTCIGATTLRQTTTDSHIT